MNEEHLQLGPLGIRGAELGEFHALTLKNQTRVRELLSAFDIIEAASSKMDGYTLARTLRDRGSTLAIVALTAHAMAEDRDKCVLAGCDDYASKPIDKAKLLAVCEAWMGKAGGLGRRKAAA